MVKEFQMEMTDAARFQVSSPAVSPLPSMSTSNSSDNAGVALIIRFSDFFVNTIASCNGSKTQIQLIQYFSRSIGFWYLLLLRHGNMMLMRPIDNTAIVKKTTLIPLRT